MIVADTSALLAFVQDEREADRIDEVLKASDQLLISAGTLAEAMIVASMRNVRPELIRLIDEMAFEVVPVTMAFSQHMANAYEKWGKGRHPAGLNFGDCFAYALAKERGCTLLFVGDDFSRT